MSSAAAFMPTSKHKEIFRSANLSASERPSRDLRGRRHYTLQQIEERADIDWLGEKRVRPGSHCSLAHGHCRKCRHEDDRCSVTPSGQARAELKARHSGHLDIAYDALRFVLDIPFEKRLGVLKDARTTSSMFDERLE